MRKILYGLGWAIVAILPVVYAVQIYMIQNLPTVEVWKWAILFGAVVLIYFTRDRDEVLKHHVV